MFKAQLDELKQLRAADDKMKREQAVRQERQYHEEIDSFNKKQEKLRW